MIEKICFLVNYNLYESKRHFTQKLAEAFNRKAIETKIIDVNEEVLTAETISALRHYAPTLTCSFNSLLPVSTGKYLWDILEIPHLAVLVDPALYSISLIRSPYSILSCVDRSDESAVRSSQFSNVFFWPHAVEKDIPDPDHDAKSYPVVFFGSCYDYESLRVSWRENHSEKINKVIDDAIEIVFSDKKSTLSEALVTAWNLTKPDATDVDFTELFYCVDYYTRGKDRVELIRSIQDAEVHVFGDLSKDSAVSVLGWQQYLSQCSNVTVHPSVPFAESLNILRQSKICLNSMPFFKYGSHERVLAGLACGAVPVTTENYYFNEMFKDGEEVVYYSMQNRSSVNEAINTLLADESKRREIANRGRSIVMSEHTWDKRVDLLIQILPSILKRIQSAAHPQS